MAPNKVILLACGSFNPPTNMHLRMFELAKDNLNRVGQYMVIGGILSPVHDAYGKKELVPSSYRCEMLRLALKSSEWIRMSDWECREESWSRTRQVLQYHQNLLNSILNDKNSNSSNKNQRNEENGLCNSNWITNEIRNTSGPVQIKLLCGADLLESFGTPGLWSDDDIETIIGQHGLVVITRTGSDPQRFIYESDVLTKYQHNIIIVTEWITNDVSSTKIRRALRRQESVKYLLDDAVIEFIKNHGLYGLPKKDFKYIYNDNDNINEKLNIPVSNYILTPSPSDINMLTVSPSHSGNIILDLKSIENINQNISEPDGVSGSSAILMKSDSSDDFGIYESLETFQSRAEIRFSEDMIRNEKNEKSQTKVVQYPGQAVQVITLDSEKDTETPTSPKKVGFIETEKIDYEFVSYDICETSDDWVGTPKKVIASVKQTPELEKVSFNGKTVKAERPALKKPLDNSENVSEECELISLDNTQSSDSVPNKKKPPKRCSKTPDLRKVSKQDGKNEKGKSNHVLKRSNSDAIMSRRNENGETVNVKIQFTKDGIKVISDRESIV